MLSTKIASKTLGTLSICLNLPPQIPLQFYVLSFTASDVLCLQTAELLLHRFLNAFEKETKQPYLLGKIRK